MNATQLTGRCPTSSDWFDEWFDSAHYQKLYAHRDDAEAARLLDSLIERRHLTAGATVLDLGCGTGRHARYLASKGFDVTGLDLSIESLRLARRSEGPNLRFIRQDMRLPFRTRTFDHVLNLFTSFGYFRDPADHVTVIHNIATALKPGGSMVLDYLNVHHAEAHLRGEELIERDGVAYRISRWSDREHLFKRIRIDGGASEAPLEYTERVSKLALEDFRFMFTVSDLRIDALYGDYCLNPFDVAASPRLILVAKKAASCLEARLPAGQILSDAADRLGRHAQVRREH